MNTGKRAGQPAAAGIAGRRNTFQAGAAVLLRMLAGGSALLSRFTGGSPAENAVFLLLVAVGATVRLYLLGAIPYGLNVDEASSGYDAWALSEYGIDRHGYRYPVHFVAWGGGLNAAYAYLTIPFIELMGLNILSVRLPMALLGVAILPAMYDIGRSMGGRRCALVFLFAAAICPWHIMMSRWSFETNLFPTLALFGFALLLRGLRDGSSPSSRWLLLPAFLLLSLCLYAYALAYVFVPIFMLGVLAYGIRRGLVDYKRWGIALGAMAVAAIPIGWFLLINLCDWEAVTTPLFSIPKYSGIPRYTTQSLFFSPDALTQLLMNGKVLLEILVRGHGDLEYNAIPGYGFFYRGGFILCLFGAGLMARDLAKGQCAAHNWLALLWLAAGLLTAPLTPPNINRVNIIFFPLVIGGAYGLFRIFAAAASSYGWRRRLLRGGAVALTAYLALSFAAFTATYFGEPRPHFLFSPPSYAAALRHLTEYADANEIVYLTRTELYIFALFYNRTDPYTYLDTVEIVEQKVDFQKVRAFGRYRFGIDENARRNGSAFLAAQQEAADFSPYRFSIFNFGEYSAIYRKPDDREQVTSRHLYGGVELQRILAAEPAARSDFSIYHDRDRRRLIYVREPCVPADLDALFFLHLLPADAEDLPEYSKRYGFENRDFEFASQPGAVMGDGCIVEKELPDYDIIIIRTGQYRPEDSLRLWEAEFPARGR